MKVNVQFTVTFDATVEVDDLSQLEDAVGDIEIPENSQCRYARDSFEPVTDENGDIKQFGND